jgi:DNA-binding NtrC family response regulator
LLSDNNTINSLFIHETITDRAVISPNGALSFQDSTRKAEKDIILKAIEEAGGNKSKAAKILNMNERTFYRKIKSLGIQ